MRKKELEESQYVWLITGAAGFIGSHLCEKLLRLNQIVIGIDNLSTGRQENMMDVTSRLSAAQLRNWQFIVHDIRDAAACHDVMRGVDFILHHAAVASVPHSIKDPRYSHAVNVGGFLNILEAAKSKNIKRVIYASSSAVYGDCADELKVESKTGVTLSPYATDKFANELYAKTFGKCYGLETIGLRYFNIFGPRQDPNGPYAAVIPIWIKAVLNKEPLIVYGDGKSTRDFCYVDNVVQANILAALTVDPRATSEVYNVASGDAISLEQLYTQITSVSGYAPQVQYHAERLGDIKYSAANIKKAERLLGFIPKTTFADGLQHTMNWYKNKQVKRNRVSVLQREFG